MQQTKELLFEQQQYEGFHAASEFYDRQAIETQAWQLINSREQLPYVEVKHQEYRDNARTALMEALTASGHISVVKIQGTLEEINTQILTRLLNGWDEKLPQHEQYRRFAEICNRLVIEKTFDSIIHGELPSDTEVLEESDWPEALQGLKLGYRDKNKKGMARSTSLIDHGNGTYTQTIEQISRSNGTADSTFSFMESSGIAIDYAKPPDIAALEAPSIYSRRDYVNGVVDVMRLLDQHSNTGVLYGDTGERTEKHPSYEKLREESARRESEIECYLDGLAELEEQLDLGIQLGEIDYEERQQIYADEVHRILDAICILEPTYAEDTFGKEIVSAFEQASILEAQGRRNEALQLINSSVGLKEEVTFCGVTISTKEAQEKGLKINGVGDLLDKGKQSWKWKQGICIVKKCLTRPGKTEVGPCNVCRKCQAKFDAGKDPTK